MVESSRLLAAYQAARDELLRQREPAGHWVGELSTSALSTATAVSALALVNRRRSAAEFSAAPLPRGPARGPHVSDQVRLDDLIFRGIHWLARNQNPDGGWGDTPRSYSNISTTMLAVAAFHLTGVPAQHDDLLGRAREYIERQGGVPGLRKRYGRDKTFAVPILANCALAGLVPWRDVAALPFELAWLPQKFYRFARLPVVSYAIPALVAIGQLRHHHRRPFNPLLGALRDAAIEPSLRVLERMQPDSGGYLEAIPLTSFVVMSLADIGRADHPVTRAGVEFLISSARDDGSWPIDTNLATWNTTLAVNALGQGPQNRESLAEDDARGADRQPESASGTELEAEAAERTGWESRCLDWLLDCQYREVHPFTGADPGAWGWSDLSGAVPDADDTPGALLALRRFYDASECPREKRSEMEAAALAGCRWLLDLQNRDGGWPTFCRGWGKLPFDRSGADLTAHALRALEAWRDLELLAADPPLGDRWHEAVQRGLRYLERTQAVDGSWVPLWFGNQDQPGEENPVYGTAKVLLAYVDRGQTNTPPARRGIDWLAAARNADGGWGGGPQGSSVEETALATETLLAAGAVDEAGSGVAWLVDAVESGRYREASPIGFYFAKLWYYEKLYPLTFTVAALGRAVGALAPPAATLPAVARHAHAAAREASGKAGIGIVPR